VLRAKAPREMRHAALDLCAAAADLAGAQWLCGNDLGQAAGIGTRGWKDDLFDWYFPWIPAGSRRARSFSAIHGAASTVGGCPVSRRSQSRHPYFPAKKCIVFLLPSRRDVGS
jgi:hypothetical protein